MPSNNIAKQQTAAIHKHCGFLFGRVSNEQWTGRVKRPFSTIRFAVSGYKVLIFELWTGQADCLFQYHQHLVVAVVRRVVRLYFVDGHFDGFVPSTAVYLYRAFLPDVVSVVFGYLVEGNLGEERVRVLLLQGFVAGGVFDVGDGFGVVADHHSGFGFGLGLLLSEEITAYLAVEVGFFDVGPLSLERFF